MAVVEGTVERITYYNDDNMYGVVKVKVKGKDDLITVVGTFPSVYVGEVIRATGEWKNHTNYGLQLQTELVESVAPATLSAIERYLGSGLIKGIGPKTAEKMVLRFGLDTLDVIEDQPHRLTEVEGIGTVKADRISRAFDDQKEIKQVMLALQSYGVTPTYGVKIYRQYGQESLEVIRTNPYKMAEDIYGIGFLTADRIGRQIGMDPASPFRVRAAIKYFLGEQADQGHVYLPQDRLIQLLQEKLEVGSELIIDSMMALEEEGQIFRDVFPDHTGVYLAPFYYAERGVAERLYTIATAPIQTELGDWQERLTAWEKENNVKLADNQRKAVEAALHSNLIVLTGGPGTGKTTTIRAIIALLAEKDCDVLLAAPTGRAAKRMAEATGREAKTVHRLLEYGYAEGEGLGFKKREDDPLDADFLIVDESSMLDLLLTYNLIKAIKPGGRLLLVGDVDQLPSVGPGNVLRDIIASRLGTLVELNEIFRQAQESMIIVNAHRINQGEFPHLNKKDFYFLDVQEPEQIVETIGQLCQTRLPSYYGFDPLTDIQVLTPQRRTQTGVEQLNLHLQSCLNGLVSGKKELKYGGRTFREGDRVIQQKNNYDKLVFNGDIGQIRWIDLEDRVVHVVYVDGEGDREVLYEQEELDEIQLAYAISVHKSQGSEYPAVVMPLSFQHYTMLQRNLFYTAITRAKQLVVVVGSRKAIGVALKNNPVILRYTNLSERLQEKLTADHMVDRE